MDNEARSTKQFVAAKGLIIKDHKILIIRESNNYGGGTNHGKYDLPGGKINPGENFREALIREAREEIGININVGEPIFIDEWKPLIKNEQIQIIGIFFICEYLGGDLVPSIDYDDYQWIDKDNYDNFPIIIEARNAISKFFS